MTPRVVVEFPDELPDEGLDALADLLLDLLEQTTDQALAIPCPVTTPGEPTR